MNTLGLGKHNLEVMGLGPPYDIAIPVVPSPPPAEQRGGFTRGRTFWDEIDEYEQARIMADDEEILAIMIAATIRILK